MQSAEARVRVRYAETDQMGVVYHSHLFVWFELGRVDFFRALGFTYREMEERDGCYLPVVDVRCRYKAPLHYDDEVIIRTRLKGMRDSLLHFTYEAVRASDGTLCAEGETTHLATDAQMNRRGLPAEFLRAFESKVSR